MALSIGGLGSGLDTTSIIQSLMAAEAGPQNALRGALGVNTVKAGAWTSLGSIVSGLQSKASAVSTSNGIAATAVTSNAPTRVSVTSTSSATPGSLTFRVNQLASAEQRASGGIASAGTVVGKTSTVITSGHDTVGATAVTAGASAVTGRHSIVVAVGADGPTFQVDGVATTATAEADGSTSLLLADGTSVQFAGAPKAGTLSIGVAVTGSDTSTMADLTAALVSAGGPARAALVDTGKGTATPFQLVLSATSTGAAGALRVTSSAPQLSGLTTLRPAADAEIVLGTGAAAITVNRASNTVSDLLPGVTINLLSADPLTDVTVEVTRDDAATSAKVKALVDNLNDTLGWIKTNSAYDIASKKGGPMVGDGSARALASQLTSAMLSGPSTGTLRSGGQLGISMTREGKYSFDDAALRKALTADPDAVAALVGSLATAVAGVAKTALAKDGVLDVGKSSTTARGKDIQNRIDDWDTKLGAIQTRYQRQFSALDVAMSRMNSQSKWLAGQISSLPTYS